MFADLHTFLDVRRRTIGEVESFASHGVGDVERIAEHVASDDAAGMLFRFAGGARGTATVSQISAGRKNAMSWEVDGSSSALSWCTESPDDLWIGHRGRPN